MQKIKTHQSIDLNTLRLNLKLTLAQHYEILRNYPSFLEKYPDSGLYKQFKQFKVENFCSINNHRLYFGFEYFFFPEDGDKQETKDFQEIVNFANQQIFEIFQLQLFFREHVEFRVSDKLSLTAINDYVCLKNQSYKATFGFDVLETIDCIFKGQTLMPDTFNKIVNDSKQILIKMPNIN